MTAAPHAVRLPVIVEAVVAALLVLGLAATFLAVRPAIGPTTFPSTQGVPADRSDLVY